MRMKVDEVTVDMAGSLNRVVDKCFPRASKVIDRFHVQQLAFDGVQEIRIKYRWEAMEEEALAIEQARKRQIAYHPGILPNGDTVKQLLARSRYLLFKYSRLWTQDKQKRSELLFTRYPITQKAYQLSLRLGEVFRLSKSRQEAFKKLAFWHADVEASGLASFKTLDKAIQQHYLGILNFFDNRSANAAAESFNAKIKAFRNAMRGVRDIEFFLLRLSKIYA